MAIKVIDVDVNNLSPIDGLKRYHAVEILFRDGRDPLGRARIACKGNVLDPARLRSLIERFPHPQPLHVTDEFLPTVTVAICTYSRPEGLSAALRSLDRQRYAPDEIIIVDNACQEAVRELAQGINPVVRYVTERKVGLNFARNRALATATGDILAFLDDDAEADQFWVRSIAECFASFPRAAALAGLTLPLELESHAQQTFEKNGGYARGFSRRIIPHDGKRLLGVQLPLVADTTDVGTGCNMAFKIAELKNLDGFDEALDTGPPLPGGGDLDMLHRVTRAGNELVYEPRAIVRHRHRTTDKELCAQLKGHQRAFISFLVKTLFEEHGRAKAGVILFMAWRILKTAYQAVNGLLGRGPLSPSLSIKIFWSCIVGFGGYHASRFRIRTQTRYTSGTPPIFRGQLPELWRCRQVIWSLTSRDLKVKYQHSFLGFLWTIMNPLITIGVIVTVFSYVVRLNIIHYWAFLISGYFAWNYFSQALNGGIQSAVSNAYLTRSSYFPQETLVISAVFARLLEFLGELIIILFILAIFHHHHFPLSFFLVLPLILVLFFVTIGFLFPLVIFAIYYKDTIQVIPLVTLVLFYISPVFYPVTFIPESVRYVYLINPIASILTLFHIILYRGEFPNLTLLFMLSLGSVFFAILSYMIFNHKKREFAEIV